MLEVQCSAILGDHDIIPNPVSTDREIPVFQSHGESTDVKEELTEQKGDPNSKATQKETYRTTNWTTEERCVQE